MDINILPENIVPDTLITLQIHGVVAIPIGHRVEVDIFEYVGDTFLGLGKPKPQYEFPFVIDIETGISYGNLEHFYKLNHSFKGTELFNAQVAPMEDLDVFKSFEGIVQNCNIFTSKLNGITTQTTLIIKVSKFIT